MKKLEPAPNVDQTLQSLTPELFNQLMSSEVTEIINKVNETYDYWDKVKYVQVPEGITAEQIWALAKLRRRTSPYYLQMGTYRFTWFLPARLQQLLHLFDMNIGGNLESRSLIPKDEKNRYLISSLMEEAIASSQIEGAVTTRRDAKEMLRKEMSPRNKSEHMILNNYRTIQKIVEIKDLDLTEQLLLDVHRSISNNTLESKDYEGAFRRTSDVNVVDVLDGEIVHQPPAAEELNVLIQQLCYFFNNDTKETFIHPIVKACIIHFLIGFIHPFVDGNGRTARALFYWYLLKKGYWLTEYLSISRLILRSKEQYARAFVYSETDENDLTYFLSYKLRTMKLAFDALREYIQRKLEEKKHVSEFLQLRGVNERQAQALKWFYEEPSLMMTVKEMETRMGIANQTARNDLNGLVELGYLQIIDINKKLQAFSKSPEFDRLIGIHRRHFGASGRTNHPNQQSLGFQYE